MESGFDIDLAKYGDSLRTVCEELTDEQIQQMALYATLLADECTRQNLSKYRTPDEILTYHLVDSLEPLRHAAFEGGERCIDIGAGGGCPGIPLKIALPGLAMGLLEARQRRCDFLKRCIQELNLERTAVLHGRAETLAHSPMHRGAYDIAVARSVAPLRQLVEYGIPFLDREGEFWTYRGHRWADELDKAQAALELLHAETTDAISYRLPGRDQDHALLVLTATGPCDDKYPRTPKQVGKRPL